MRRERERDRYLVEEIMAESFPNLGKPIDIQIQEAQRSPDKMNLERPTPRHNITEVLNVKQREC